jgi:HEPN domain-containing protein
VSGEEGHSGLEAEVLERSAWDKLNTARLLLDHGYPGDAYYLAGYAVEFALKSRIAGRFRARTIPDLALVRQIYTHSLDALAHHAGVLVALKQSMDANPAIRYAWDTARTWNVEARYGGVSVDRARQYIDAVGGTNGTGGLIAWLLSRT